MSYRRRTLHGETGETMARTDERRKKIEELTRKNKVEANLGFRVRNSEGILDI